MPPGKRPAEKAYTAKKKKEVDRLMQEVSVTDSKGRRAYATRTNLAPKKGASSKAVAVTYRGQTRYVPPSLLNYSDTGRAKRKPR